MGKQSLDYEALYALTAHALSAGAQRQSAMRTEWDVSGGCESTLEFEFKARPRQLSASAVRGVAKPFAVALVKSGLVRPDLHSREFNYDVGLNHPLWLRLVARCRKCGWCLKARAREWATKARAEIESCPGRTWFCTFTLTPDEQFQALSKARMADADGGEPFEARHPDDQFRCVVAALGPDITRYVKRVRKQSCSPLRYLWVTEKHKTGLPHFHALFHETDPARPLRKRVLQEQWRAGFSQVKLVGDSAAAWYLCKYLSKDVATRVRSSLRYGIPTYVHSNGEATYVKRDPPKSVVVPAVPGPLMGSVAGENYA